MKTIKDKVAEAATALGCRSQSLDHVWTELQGYPLPLTARSLVLQVADAMKAVGVEPDTTDVNAIARRL